MKTTVAKLSAGQRFRIKLTAAGYTAFYVLTEKAPTRMGWDLGCQTPERIRWYTGLPDDAEVEIDVGGAP